MPRLLHPQGTRITQLAIRPTVVSILLPVPSVRALPPSANPIGQVQPGAVQMPPPS